MQLWYDLVLRRATSRCATSRWLFLAALRRSVLQVRPRATPSTARPTVGYPDPHGGHQLTRTAHVQHHRVRLRHHRTSSAAQGSPTGHAVNASLPAQAHTERRQQGKAAAAVAATAASNPCARHVGAARSVPQQRCSLCWQCPPPARVAVCVCASSRCGGDHRGGIGGSGCAADAWCWGGWHAVLAATCIPGVQPVVVACCCSQDVGGCQHTCASYPFQRSV